MSEQPLFAQQTSTELARGGTPLDPERLRNITEAFSAPQLGLGLAAAGAAHAANMMITLYWPGSPRASVGTLLLVAGWVGYFLIPRYYRSRFGWVEQKPQPVRPAKELGLVILVGLLITAGFVAFLFQSLGQVPVNFLTLLQSFVLFSAIFCFAFTSRGRSMPARLTIWASLAIAQGLLAGLPLWVSLGARQMLVWKLLNTCSSGIFMIAVGLCNHVAMVRLLPNRIEEDTHA